jgi:hypothetical protein
MVRNRELFQPAVDIILSESYFSGDPDMRQANP